MNKTEKLLAARKKLKEFQQNKLHNNHQQSESAQDQPRENQEQNVALPPPSESPKTETTEPSTSTETPPLITALQSETPPATEPMHSHANEEPPSLQQDIPPPEVPELPPQNHTPPANPNPQPPIFDAFKVPEQQSPEVDIFHQLSSVQNGTIDNSSQNGSLEDSPSLQKQHLLQMATDVANALGESDNDAESAPIHSDLEYRNQFLSTCLEEQKRLVNQLHVQVSQYSSRVSELEALLSTKDAEFEAKLLREVGPLKDQLKVHAQTTGILVAEKAELTAAVTQYQTAAHQKTEEVEQLCGKLKSSQSRISELEKELTNLKDSTEEMRKNYTKLQSDNTHLNTQFRSLIKEREEQAFETMELRQMLYRKNIELQNLHAELDEKENLIGLAELKIRQITNVTDEMQSLEGQQQSRTVLELQLRQLRDAVKSANMDKIEATQHYERHVKELEARYEKIVAELEATKKEVKVVEDREHSYIQRLSLMEQRIQQQRQQLETLEPLKEHEEKIQHLTKSMDALVLEQESLQATIREEDAEIESLRDELEKLREIEDQRVDSVKLASALESEQLGAARAVSQNQELKAQLNEMHDAFVTLSNSKLDLTEKLQGERTIGRKLNAELNRVEAERDELRAELERKNAEIEELEKDKLQVAQIADQMQHYQAQSSHSRTLQEELQNTMSVLEMVRRENEGLRERLSWLENNHHSHNAAQEGVNAAQGVEENASQAVDETVPQRIDNSVLQNAAVSKAHIASQTEAVVSNLIDHGVHNEQSTLTSGEIQQSGQVIEKRDSEVQTAENSELHRIVSSEAFVKLEARFKETMEKVAELTDEKQRLEHLVLQLQGETETIGEYITLYQKQRAILHKKAEEKEQTFRQLVEQRNQQQVQLHQLKVLVAELLKSQTSEVNQLVVNQETSSTVPPQTLPGNEPNLGNQAEELKPEQLPQPPAINAKNETAAKILDLLTEIKDCKDTCSLEPNFHPCLWCSGKLITV